MSLANYNACAGLYPSMGKTKELMYISLIMNGINVMGNAIGVFILHAGVAGVAYPSLISRTFAAVVMLVFMSNKQNVLYLRIKNVMTWNGEMLGRIFRVALLNSIESGLWAAGDIKFNLYSSIFSSVICRVALSVIFGIWLNLGVIGVTLAMVCDWLIKAMMVAFRYRSGKWKQFKLI